MSLHFFHTELAFVGIGVPIGPTDGQVQEGAGLHVNQAFTHWLERRNHSIHFSASRTHFFPSEHSGTSKCHRQPGSLCLGAVHAHSGAGAAESLSGTRGLGFGVGLLPEQQHQKPVAMRLGTISGSSLSPRHTGHTHLKPRTKKTRIILPFSDHSLHSALPLKQSRDP